MFYLPIILFKAQSPLCKIQSHSYLQLTKNRLEYLTKSYSGDTIFVTGILYTQISLSHKTWRWLQMKKNPTERIYDNTILLYRIVPEERRVEFIITQNDNDAIKKISEDDITSLSYDELLKDTIEFHQSFQQIKAIISEQKELMREDKKAADNQLKILDVFENDSNFLFKYYINRFRSIFTAEHSYVVKKEWRASKCKTKDRIDIFLNNIDTITDPAYFSHFYTTTKSKLLFESDFIIQEDYALRRCIGAEICIQERLVKFDVSYFSLIEFFYDFSSKLSASEAFVNKCKCCNNYFFGEKNALYCAAPSCQKEYKRIIRNKKEYDRTHAPDKQPIKAVDDCVSTTKSRLSEKTNNDKQLMSEYSIEAKKVKQEIRDEVERRIIEHEPFDDDSMNKIISGLKYRIRNLYQDLTEKFKCT